MPTRTSMTSGEEREPSTSQAWSRRAQIVFVSVAMPVLVLLLVGAPYLLAHYIVNRHYRFNYIPPPLGGDRALEGHWTDAPVVPVRQVNFGTDWSAFGWIAPNDDLTTNVMATATGTVSQIFTSVGQAVAKDAPLIAIRTKPAKTNPTDVFPTGPEIVIAAPVAGVVTQIGVEVGQAVKAAPPATATKAASIADLSSLGVVAEIDEIDARPLRSGQLVEVRPTALAGRIYKGKLTSVSPVDPATRRAAVRIAVENTDGALKPGMLAQFNLPNANETATLAVPEGAVLFENDSARVFVTHDEKSVRDVSPARS
jgi:Barrel-sandwich domain of CusB or HlyD membrane-fusion